MLSLVIITFFAYVGWCEFQKTSFYKALCQSGLRIVHVFVEEIHNLKRVLIGNRRRTVGIEVSRR